MSEAPAATTPPADATAAGYALDFSHVGFFVIDMDKMAAFYSQVMGFFITDQGMLGDKRITFLSRNPREHHQIVLVAGREPGSHQNINQISFRVGSLGELKTFYDQITNHEVSHLEPIIHGNSWSIYFRDPEGNRIEVFADSDWYISQPFKEPLDLSRPETEIREHTRAYCATRAGFKPIAEWHEDMRRLMAAGQPSARTP